MIKPDDIFDYMQAVLKDDHKKIAFLCYVFGMLQHRMTTEELLDMNKKINQLI